MIDSEHVDTAFVCFGFKFTKYERNRSQVPVYLRGEQGRRATLLWSAPGCQPLLLIEKADSRHRNLVATCTRVDTQAFLPSPLPRFPRVVAGCFSSLGPPHPALPLMHPSVPSYLDLASVLPFWQRLFSLFLTRYFQQSYNRFYS